MRNCWLSEYYQTRLHMCHVSTRGALEAIQMAKLRGAPVTCEVTPHHLWFNNETCDYRVNPPIRTADDVQALIDGIRSGVVDAIATDHAPHSPEEKADFEKAPNGIIGLETSFAASCTALVASGRMSLARLIEVMSVNPCRILSIPGGEIRVGGPADLVLLAPEERWTFTEADIGSKSRNTPFLGTEFTGRVHCTIKGGEITWQLKK